MIVKRRWTIRTLLLGVNLSILLVPVGTVVFLKVFQAYLLRQTERKLISEGVLVGEAWRDRLLVEQGLAEEPSFRPPGHAEDSFVPFRPLLDLGYEVLPETAGPAAEDRGQGRSDPEWRAGAAIEPLLRRAQAFNLSGARVLDRRGCVVASSGSDRGICPDRQQEVDRALGGTYSAVVRRKSSSESRLPLDTLQRRSELRVHVVIPIYMHGDVAGVVRMARTTVSPIEMMWAHRGKVGLVAGVVLLFTPVMSYLFSHAISKPVRDLTRAAESMAAGAPRRAFVPGGMAPREVLILSGALNRMTEQLTEKSEYMVQFASNVSHELKTPITGITGAIELLQDEWRSMTEDQRKRFLRNMAADASRLERLAAGLLQLARVESVREQEEPIDVDAFVFRLAERYGDAIRIRSEEGRTLRINREQLEMALHNLVDNGLRHGQGKPVEVDVSFQDGRCRVSVRDHGPGINEDDRPHVFDRFFTTERERGGTGLGLSIVKAIAEARGGSIDFESGSRGTVFRLVL